MRTHIQNPVKFIWHGSEHAPVVVLFYCKAFTSRVTRMVFRIPIIIAIMAFNQLMILLCNDQPLEPSNWKINHTMTRISVVVDREMKVAEIKFRMNSKFNMIYKRRLNVVHELPYRPTIKVKKILTGFYFLYFILDLISY